MSFVQRTCRALQLRRAAVAAATATATAAVLVAGTGATASAASAPDGQGAAPTSNMREGGLAEVGYRFVFKPGVTRGANDWGCTPTAEHPNPVILVPGTFANHGASFVKMSPRLNNAGYCVFTINYGMTQVSGGRIGGLGHIKDSAEQEFAPFVQRVLDETGAAKVDIVGHSQGGSVPMWFIKKMGGAAKVDHYVGWAPSSRGTSLNGIVTLGETFQAMGWVAGFAEFGKFPGAIDQTFSSDYTKTLFPNGSNDVPDGPTYLVISTKQDRVVTPYYTQKLSGADVTNVTLQDKCPLDQTGHAFIFLDNPTLQMTMNALADGPTDFQPECTGFSPIPFA